MKYAISMELEKPVVSTSKGSRKTWNF